MDRRTFITSATSLGALLTAGCLGGSSAGGSDATTTTATPTPEPAPVPEPDVVFRTESGVLRAVHMGGDQIEDADTTEVYVTVDGERTTTWVSDDPDAETPPYPVSFGNYVEIPEATPGSTVAVVWVGRTGREATLATYDVPTPTPEPTTEAPAEGTETAGATTETATAETTTDSA